MSAWLFGVALALLTGSAATAYLWLIRRRDDETAAGLLAVAGLRWRDFSRLVLEAMGARGLTRAAAINEEPQEHSASFILSGQGQRWLLACKHGSAYRIGSAMMEELAADVRLHGAGSGILVTEGTVDKGGLSKAEKYNIEVLDGARLWPEIRPLMDNTLLQRISSNAAERARRHTVIAWMAAITLGILAAVTLPSVHDDAPVQAAAGGLTPAPLTEDGGNSAGPVPGSPAAAAPGARLAPRSEEDVAKDRAAISLALSNTSGISRGLWISKSTLSIDRNIAEREAWLIVCSQLAKYPDLSLTRVQMNAPPGSTDPVRWRQCGTF